MFPQDQVVKVQHAVLLALNFEGDRVNAAGHAAQVNLARKGKCIPIALIVGTKGSAWLRFLINLDIDRHGRRIMF